MRISPFWLTLLLPGAILAQTLDRNDREASLQYQHCIELARNSPLEGWQESLAWGSLGGGEPAHHCGAVAMIGMRQFEEAAQRLQILAEQSEAEPRLRAGMLAQAGQAWLLAKQPDQALIAQDKALELVPGAPDLLVDRAQSQAELRHYQSALDDLDLALQSLHDRPEALIFRATAKRHLDDLAGAREDIALALKLDAAAQDGWLEDGILKLLANDREGARESWQKVLSLAPQSEAAETARRDLELLDAAQR